MKDVHEIYTVFKTEFPELSGILDSTSKALHEKGGPLDARTRALVKIAASAASRHHTAFETHVVAAREAGVDESEIVHAMLLVVTTCGFPTFMEAYSKYKAL